MQLVLGALMMVQEQKSKGGPINPAINTIVQACGESLYNISFSGDIDILRNMTSTLNDAQKLLMQNVVKAIAASKKAQADVSQKPKEVAKPAAKPSQQLTRPQNTLFSDGKRTKLVTKIGK